MSIMKLLVACFAVGASAYVPMAPGAALTRSKVASSSYAQAPVVALRTAEVSMNAVTERDADGNPVTQMSMIDPIYLAVCLAPFLYLLVTNPF